MNFKKKQLVILCFLLIPLLFLTLDNNENEIFNLDENLDIDNEETLTVNNPDASLYDGLYLNYNWYYSIFNTTMNMTLYYNQDVGSVFNVTAGMGEGLIQQENNDTRFITNSYGGYNNFTHTNKWVFTNVSLGSIVQLSILVMGDRDFEVVDELTYFSPELGPMEVWVLNDSTTSGQAWYEKSTGYLINGTFNIFLDYYYTYSLYETNAVFTSITNDYPPELSNGGFKPLNVNQTSLINFTVDYLDQDNIYPKYIYLHLNGTMIYPMTKVNTLDDIYTDGCKYQYLTYLQPRDYNYSFSCSDFKFLNNTINQTMTVNDAGNLATPVLSNPYVNPTLGNNNTEYLFSVEYSDSDNNGPKVINVTINGTTYGLEKVDIFDENYLDGCLYQYEINLTVPGTYNYTFNCSDGINLASIGPFIGTQVNPTHSPLFNGLYMNYTFYHSLIGTSYNSSFSYTSLGSNLFGVDYISDFSGVSYFVENNCSRLIVSSDNTVYAQDTHANEWIFRSVEIGSFVQIGVLGDYPRNFEVVGDESYDLPGHGPIEVWVLNDTISQGQAWYEKSTGILINGSFYFTVGFAGEYYTYNNIETNAVFTSATNDYMPELLNGGYSPINVNQTSFINFTVDYYDQDNIYPKYVNLDIDGTISLPMTKVDPLDTNYVDGCTYQVQTYLQPGDHNYSFSCSDFKFLNYTTNQTITVNLVNLNAPSLINPDLDLFIGNNETLFTFTVEYFDSENNFPAWINVTLNDTTTFEMSMVDPLDVNAVDGLSYFLTTTMDWGYYEYQIVCNDGDFSNSTSWFNGPEVNPFWIIVFEDDFETGALGTDWVSTSSAGVGTQTSNSGIYSAYIDGTAGNITLKPVDLSGYFSLYVSYWIRIGDDAYSEDPDNGEELVFEYYNDMGMWVQLAFYDYDVPEGTIWTVNMTLPDDAFHSAFQIRFRQLGGTGSGMDYWHIDDVKLRGYGCNPISPLNSSIIFVGINNFTWNSIDAYYGACNYTIEISDIFDFSNIINTTTNIIESPNNTSILINLNSPLGTYYWRIRPSYNIFHGNWSDIYEFILEVNNFEPTLTNIQITPKIGNQLTMFDFRVTYTDIDNNSPSFMNVTINGTSHELQKLNDLDVDYTDGCIYNVSLSLPVATANYSYYFECYDGIYYENTGIYNDLEVNLLNDYEPMLLSPQVSPNQGVNSTVYNFTVWYYDVDNNFPFWVDVTLNDTSVYSMEQADISNTNAIDGVLFYVNTTLNFGYYEFEISCFDGMYGNSTGWINGPEVDPFLSITSDIFSDDFENGLSQWVEMTGLWHLTNSSSIWPDTYRSFEHSIWFGQESTGTYDTGDTEFGIITSIPFDLSSNTDAFLEFYHYREGESGYDYSYVYVSTDGINWDQIYSSDTTPIVPWERVVLDLTSYCGFSSVQIRFTFDTQDEISNGFKGWLIDDITILSNNTGSSGINLISPVNGTILNGRLNNFTWSSLEASFGIVNYTIQISDQPDFSNIINETSGIPETAINTSIEVFINDGNGMYYWRVRPTYSIFNGEWGSPYQFNLYTNEVAPSLTDMQITPKIGNQLTMFDFRVTYTDIENNPATYVNLTINGTTYQLEKLNGADMDYTDGCIYNLTLMLNPNAFNYTYYFECNDGIFMNTSSVFNDVQVDLLNDATPWLINPEVSPNSGINTTLYEFRVTYMDADNNFPSSINVTLNNTQVLTMNKEFPSDMSALDGVIYIATISSLNWGYYEYQVSCFDGAHLNTTALNFGPTVNPFNIPHSVTLNSPIDGVTLNNLSNIYVWGSLDSSLGLCNYTIQISDQSDFSIIINETTNIEETLVNTNITVDLIAPNGIYYWRVRPTYHNFVGNWSVANQFTLYKNEIEPSLTDIQISPIVGNQLTIFNFSVNYIEIENNSPSFIYLTINGTSYELQKLNDLDVDYTDGCIYNVSLILTPAVFNYTYYFSCSDGIFINSTNPQNNLQVDILNTLPPILSNPIVSPLSGYNTVVFSFTVTYYDTENNLPTFINLTLSNGISYEMIKVDFGDNDSMDGIDYILETHLEIGSYEFIINCSDGLFNQSTGWLVGPNVVEDIGSDNPGGELELGGILILAGIAISVLVAVLIPRKKSKKKISKDPQVQSLTKIYRDMKGPGKHRDDSSWDLEL